MLADDGSTLAGEPVRLHAVSGGSCSMVSTVSLVKRLTDIHDLGALIGVGPCCTCGSGPAVRKLDAPRHGEHSVDASDDAPRAAAHES
mmetsp:Transcript_51045/g.141234  ORF Transcript_51045/g.141234 Transcript_51045/m.141234 type:complete len:88 (-) Transcript_51045:59-322(-)